MIKKRFILHEHDNYGDAIEDTMTDDWLDSSYQYTDKLNKLNDENKELRMVIDGLKQQNQKLKGRLNDLGVEYYD